MTSSTKQSEPTFDDNVLYRFRLDGKAAVITGAGAGIGRAFAHALVDAGAQVALVDRDESALAIVQEELKSKEPRLWPSRRT